MNTNKVILSEDRKEIPPFQKIAHFDIDRLVKECQEMNLFDLSKWYNINYKNDKDGQFLNISTQHSNYYKAWFDFENLNYRDLFLNEIDYNLISSTSKETFDNVRSRARVVRNKELLKNQNNAELIFLPVLKEQFKNTYIEQIYREIGSMFEGGPGRIKIGFMGPNSNVKSHIDADSALILKVHVPLLTNNLVTFKSLYKNNIEEYNMKADGSAILLNVGIPHSVENKSLEDRFHLIINVYVKQL